MYTFVIKQIKIVNHNFVLSINKKSRKRANGLCKGAIRELLTDTVQGKRTDQSYRLESRTQTCDSRILQMILSKFMLNQTFKLLQVLNLCSKIN